MHLNIKNYKSLLTPLEEDTFIRIKNRHPLLKNRYLPLKIN